MLYPVIYSSTQASLDVVSCLQRRWYLLRCKRENAMDVIRTDRQTERRCRKKSRTHRNGKVKEDSKENWKAKGDCAGIVK